MDYVTNWGVKEVCEWLCTIGYEAYEKPFRDNVITGSVLLHLDHVALKELTIRSVGKRLRLLKAIYLLKTEHQIPLEPDDYIPPSVEYDLHDDESGNYSEEYRRFHAALKDRDALIQSLQQEIGRLTSDLATLREELRPVWKLVQSDKKKEQSTSQKRPAPIITKFLGSSSHSKPAGNTSPGLPASKHANSRSHFESSHTPPSPSSPCESHSSGSHLGYAQPRPSYSDNGSVYNMHPPGYSPHNLESAGEGAIRVYSDKMLDRANEAYKSFRISLDDPCRKVIAGALKKYKIHDDWKNYCLVVCFGNTERVLTPEEKPLQLYQQLKETTDSPVSFVLKHVKQVKHFGIKPDETASLSLENLRLSGE
ncbi:RA-domain-containing protein [Basidiobolus meristosporus CBS 931.73]|uniref:RA-domain-containing protein n=1 Tax=Basidiobolus meristosporus CBS 931.73 TaxID=1314790 RepID=A0A1Y1YJM8_9FUNG|nr:RA-domain-containing protein [Basidiobolus meristosporus CBS 931.73]|eukprot:ORX98231.1 RA-domain-containing protein [Basidiobolus meristosporus CBS 931.73]